MLQAPKTITIIHHFDKECQGDCHGITIKFDDCVVKEYDGRCEINGFYDITQRFLDGASYTYSELLILLPEPTIETIADAQDGVW